MKVYAVIGKRRFSGLPDVPTFGDLGYKKLDVDFWHMLLAPAGTPQPMIDKLNAALRTALADPKLLQTYAQGGITAYPMSDETPEFAAALLKKGNSAVGRRDPHQSYFRAVKVVPTGRVAPSTLR